MNDLATTSNAFNPPALQQFGIESAATAVASQAKAMVEARYTIALNRPRNWDQVRQDLLKECHRPTFANNKSALYRKPIGAGVEGLGIRFVEVALRCMTNVLVETTMIFEDAQKEIHRVSVTDLESNVTYPLDVKVSKTVERSKPADDGSFISMRKNSFGKNVYSVPANDDDLLNKRAALISKAIRTLGLRIVPGDLCDEAEEIIRAVRMDAAARDPEAERKKLADAFSGMGVKASQLAEYLGHDIGSCSPPELVNLRGLYGAIKDGEATWATVMENKAEQTGVPIKKAGNSTTLRDIQDKAGAKKKPGIDPDTGETSAPAAPPPADAPTLTYAILAGQLNSATSRDTADLVLDTARHLPADQQSELAALVEAKFPA